MLMDKEPRLLPITHRVRQAKDPDGFSQDWVDLRYLPLDQEPRTARALYLYRPAQGFYLESAYPIGFRPWSMALEVLHLTTTHALVDQHRAMQGLVAGSMGRKLALVLDRQNHGIGDRRLFLAHKITTLTSKAIFFKTL